ncbi:hypothetical protein MKW92_027202, partial [Papaver armeniacum]
MPVKVDLSSIEPGSIVIVKLLEKAVFIRRCTVDDIKLAISIESVDQGTLCDPEDDAVRVKNPEWSIVVGV